MIEILLDNGIAEDRAQEFARSLRNRRFPPKHVIFSEGDQLPPVVFVLSGYVRLLVTNEDGDISTRYITGSGNFAGCIQATLYNDASCYTCESIGDCEVILIDQLLIREARKKDATLMMMQDIIIRRLIEMMQEKALMLPLKATDRYLFFRERYPKIVKEIPDGIVANYIGVRPQSLSRIKNTLK